MSGGGGEVYVVPVSPGRTVIVSGPWPLAEREWRRLEMILGLFRPGLVEPDDEVDAEVADGWEA